MCWGSSGKIAHRSFQLCALCEILGRS